MINKRITFSLALSLLTSLVSIGQKQSYSGEYKNGIATYQYIENEDYERIYNGSFQYKGTAPFGEKIMMNGSFSNNKMHGYWKFQNGNQLYEGNFDEGFFDGDWYVKNTKTGKTISKASFVKGKFVGSFLYEEKDFKITASFDKQGRLDDELRIIYKDGNESFEDIQKYSSGILSFRLHRNNSTGEVIDKQDNKDFVSRFLQQSDSSAIIDTVLYVTLDYSNDDLYWPYELEKERRKFSGFNHEDGAFVVSMGTWLYNQAIGFKEFYEGTFTVGEKEKYLKNSGISKIIVEYSKTSLGKNQALRQKQIDKERATTFNSLEKIKVDLRNNRYKSATSFKTASYNLNLLKGRLTSPKYAENNKAFEQKLEDAISIEKELISQKESFELATKVSTLVTKGDSYWSEVIHTKNSRDYYSEDDNYVRQMKPDLEKAISNYKSAYELSTDSSIKLKLENASKELSLVQELEDSVRKKKRLKELEYLTKKSHDTVSQLFSTASNKKLFNYYNKIYSKLTREKLIVNRKYIVDDLPDFELLANLQEKMKVLSNMDTKELEKQLKKMDNYQDQISAIMNK